MHKLAAPLAGTGLLLLLAAGAVSAASPAPTDAGATAPAVTTTPAATPVAAADTDPIADILGLTVDELRDLRHEGLSLAQIAERQGVEPQRLIDALVVRWTTRIETRVAVGALTEEQAAPLREELQVRAKAMVNQATMGGMQGAAVGAGPNGAGRGAGAGAGPGASVQAWAPTATEPAGAARCAVPATATAPARWPTPRRPADHHSMGRASRSGRPPYDGARHEQHPGRRR